MVKVRLSGLLNDVIKVSDTLKKHFKILQESDTYKNKNSEYIRKYIEMENNEEEHEKTN